MTQCLLLLPFAERFLRGHFSGSLGDYFDELLVGFAVGLLSDDIQALFP